MVYSTSTNQFTYAPDPIVSAENLPDNTQSHTSLILLLIFIQILSVLSIGIITFLAITKYGSKLESQSQYPNTYIYPTSRPIPTINPFNPLSNQVSLDFSKGDYETMQIEANKLFTYAQSDEEKAIAYYWQGLASYSLKNYNEAQTFLVKATTFKPDYAAPYSTLSALAIARQDNQKALEYSQKCVSLDPNYAWCHNNLGISYIINGQKDKGISEIRQAISLDPTSFTFNDNLKRALAQ